MCSPKHKNNYDINNLPKLILLNVDTYSRLSIQDKERFRVLKMVPSSVKMEHELRKVVMSYLM